MRPYTVKVFFNDGTQISVDCDDFTVSKGRYYSVFKDGIRVMTFPLSSVKYTSTIANED